MRSRGSSPATAPGTRSPRCSVGAPTAPCRSSRSRGRPPPDARRMTAREQERELKFTPGPSFRAGDVIERLPGLRAGEPTTRTLHATYYDTPDLRLARMGASLRWRDDQGWTVKLPAAGSEGGLLSRQEITVDGEPHAVPTAATDLVHALVRS